MSGCAVKTSQQIIVKLLRNWSFFGVALTLTPFELTTWPVDITHYV